MPFPKYVPPMGIYETLYAFLAAYGSPMGIRAHIRGASSSLAPTSCPAVRRFQLR